MIATYPVRIREIDTDRSGRIAVTGKCCHIDDLCSHTLHFRLLESVINRRIVFEPLRVVTDKFCTA